MLFGFEAICFNEAMKKATQLYFQRDIRAKLKSQKTIHNRPVKNK